MVINEPDALEIFHAMDTMPEEMKPRAAKLLADYRTQQDNAGKPLWPEGLKRQREQQSRFWAEFENPRLLDEVEGTYMEADRLSPGLGEKLRYKELQIKFLAKKYGRPIEEVRKQPDLFAVDYGADNWKESKVLEPKQFFERAKVEVLKEKASHELVYGAAQNENDEGLIGAAYVSALTADKSGFQTWLESARKHPGYDASKEGDYLNAWNQTRAKVDEEMGGNGRIIRSVVRMLQLQKGTSDTQEANEAYWAHPERELRKLAANDPKAYRHAKQLIIELAKRGPKDDKNGLFGWLQRAGESFGRGIENIADGALEGTQIGGSVLSSALGNEQDAKIIRAGVTVARDLRNIAHGAVDPIERRDIIDRGVFGILESGPTMVGAMHPAGRLLLAGSYGAEASGNFADNGWTGPGAEAAALSVGVFSTAVEYASELLGKIPGVAQGLAAVGAKPGSRWGSQFLLQMMGRAPIEIGEEAVQDMAAPAVQSVLSAFDVVAARDKSFAEEWEEWKIHSLPDVILIALPLAALGAGISSRQEIGRAKVDALTRDTAELARVFGDTEAVRIAAEPDGERRVSLIRETWDSQSKEDRLARLKLQSELQSLQASHEGASAAEAAAYTVNVTRNAQGWQVKAGDGTVVKVDSPEAARRIREDLKQVATQEEAEALVQAMDDWHESRGAGVDSSTTLTGETVTSDGQSIIGQRDGRITREITDGRTLETLRQEAAMEAQAGGNEDVSVLVNGSNSVFVERVGDTVKGIVQRMEMNQSSVPQVMTFLHEGLESTWRTGMQTGVFSLEMTQRAARAVLPVLNPRKARSAEEKALYERVAKIAEGLATETEMRETMVELAVRDVLERDRSGRRTGMRAGSITRALDAAIVGATNPGDAKALAKIRAFFRSVRAWLAGVMGTVRTLKKAKDAGKLGEDWETFIDKMLGIEEQVRYDRELAAELEAIADQDTATAWQPTEADLDAGMAFSLQIKPGDVVSIPNATSHPVAEIHSVDHVPGGLWVVFKDGFAKKFSYFSELPKPVDPRRAARYREGDGRAGTIHREREALEGLRYQEPAETGPGGLSRQTITPRDYLAQPKTAEEGGITYGRKRPPGVKAKSLKVGDALAGLGVISAKQARGRGFWFDFEKGHGAYFDSESRLTRAPRAVPADASKVTVLPDGAHLVGPTSFSIRAYHGTPHKVDKFSLDKIGTGEGAQAYGWGLYFASNPKVARSYQKGLTERDYIRKVREVFSEFDSPQDAVEALAELDLSDGQRKLLAVLEKEDWWGFNYPHQAVQAALREPENFDPSPEVLEALDSFGSFYTVDLLPDEDAFLDWDKPLSEQSGKVKAALSPLLETAPTRGPRYARVAADGSMDAESVLMLAGLESVSPEAASKALASLGIPGIKYLDGNSRDGGSGTSNYVIFDDKLVKILEENGSPVEQGQTSFSLSSRKFLPGDYPASLAKTITSTSVGALTKHPRYQDAKKGGDGAAADAVVNDTLKPAKVEELRSLIAGRAVTWVPVMHRDTGRRANALPMVYAEELSYRLGGEVSEDIVKASGAANTGVAVQDRFANEQSFSGPVDRGAFYVVVDDNHTSGDTLASLIDHIQAGGGEVIAATALAHSQSQNYLKTRPEDVAKLLDKVGLDEASFLREFGYSIQAFTGSEAYRLANLDRGRGIEWLRSRIPASRSQADSGRSTGSSPQASGEGELRFSISPGARIAEVQAQIDARLVKDPEARRKMAMDAKQRLQALKERWETERWTWKGDRIRPLVDKTTGRILDHQQAFRQAVREAELVDAGMAALTPETIHAYHVGVGALEQQPLVFAMLHHNGRLMSKTTALSQDKDIGGDYDGAVWIPPAWYGRGAGLMPDVMAQNLFEQGLINDPSTDALWNALGEVIKSHRSARAEFEKAAAAVRDVERQATEQARKETQAWRDEQDAMQAKDWSPRASLVRDMQTLDAMLSVLPAEVRGKVGGFVRLAQLGSEKSRLEEIQRRIERLDILLEKHLQKELREHIGKLFDKARPDTKAGKKPKGNMTAEAHRLAAMAKTFSKVPEADMNGERKKLEDALLEPDADFAEVSERMQVLELFGGMDKANSASLEAAVNWLSGVVKTGKNMWRLLQEMRLLDQKALAETLAKDTGKAGDIADLQRGIADEKTIKREAGGWGYGLISYEQTITALFGADSAVGQRLVAMARAATYQRTDAIRAKRQAWQVAMSDIWKGKTWGEVQEALWEHSQVDSSLAMSVGRMAGRKESKVQVPMEIALRVVADPPQAKALGFTAAEVDVLETLIEENDTKPGNEQREILEITRLSPGTSTATPLSQLQAVNMTMLARQRDYQDTLTYHGWTPDVIAEMESKLTPEAKAIRDWLATQYRQGYSSINEVFQRMFGAPLPSIENYSPGTWESLMPGQDMTPEGGVMGMGGISPGPLKTRRVHRAPPRLADALVTYWQHTGQMEHFKAFAEVVREARGVMLRPEVRASIQEKGGKTALDSVETWIKIFENDGLRRAAALGKDEQFSSRLQNVFSMSVLAWNVGTLAKQSLATLGAAYEMPAMAYARGFKRLVSGELDFGAMLTSDTIRRRVEAGASPELRQVMAGMMGAHPGKWTRAPRQFVMQGMELLGEADAFFTAASAAIYYDYALGGAKSAGMPDVQAKAEALRRTEAMVARTAQPVELMDRSLYEAKAAANPNQRWLFMFASEARQKAAIYGMSLGRILTGQGNAGDFRVMVISHVVAPLMLQTITNMLADWRNDDDDEIFDMESWSPLRYVKAMLMGPLSGVPLLSGVVNSVLSAATGQPSWDSDPTNPVGELFSKTISASRGAFKDGEQEPVEKGVTAAKAALNLAAAASAFHPAGQAFSWLGSAGNILDQLFDTADNLQGKDRK